MKEQNVQVSPVQQFMPLTRMYLLLFTLHIVYIAFFCHWEQRTQQTFRTEEGKSQEFIDITKRAAVGSHRVLDVFLLVLLLHLINYPRLHDSYRDLKQTQRAVWWGEKEGKTPGAQTATWRVGAILQTQFCCQCLGKKLGGKRNWARRQVFQACTDAVL